MPIRLYLPNEQLFNISYLYSLPLLKLPQILYTFKILLFCRSKKQNTEATIILEPNVHSNIYLGTKAELICHVCYSTSKLTI